MLRCTTYFSGWLVRWYGFRSSRSGRKSLTRLAKTGIFQEWGGDFWAAVSQDDFRFRGAARLAPTEEGTLARLKACRERGINPSE